MSVSSNTHYIDMENLQPPQPPPSSKNDFTPGEFKYITNSNHRDMLQNAYRSITITETWNFIKKDINSFAFSNSREIYSISDKMNELGYNGHSGSSFGWTMREMQFIAQHGENRYKQIHENN